MVPCPIGWDIAANDYSKRIKSIETIGFFLDSQPFIALFLIIGLGYAVDQIKIGGLSLGIGAVLFVGLGVDAIAPKAVPPGLLGTVGLLFMIRTWLKPPSL
jgi:putative transport protein